jgi:arabinose-5-phosphate isomerase
MLALLPHLRRRGANLIAVTGQRGSTLARLSTVVLDVQVDTEACPLNLAPTCSTTNMLALGDALAMVLLQSRGFNAQDFAALHPGGTLGRRLLTRVREIMRTGSGLARVRAVDKVPDVLAAMTRARAGAAVVVSEAGELEGIFTHGDFVRSYQANRDISEHAVSVFMSRNPVTIEENQLAEEVVRLLAKNAIDDIVVVDQLRRVVGIVDIQDLSRARLV